VNTRFPDLQRIKISIEKDEQIGVRTYESANTGAAISFMAQGGRHPAIAAASPAPAMVETVAGQQTMATSTRRASYYCSSKPGLSTVETAAGWRAMATSSRQVSCYCSSKPDLSHGGDSGRVVGDNNKGVGNSNKVAGNSDGVVGDSRKAVGDSDKVPGDSGMTAGNSKVPRPEMNQVSIEKEEQTGICTRNTRLRQGGPQAQGRASCY
jgi:hypothetical protein